MTKKKNIVKKSVESRHDELDTVIFMTAYNIHEFKRHFSRFWQYRKNKELLKQYHILGISNKKMYVSQETKCNYTVKYDSLKQVSAFNFDDSIIEIKARNPRLWDEMMTTLSLHHSSNALLDTSQIDVFMCFNMESFLVEIGTKILQVDPVAFMVNGSLIVNFELIDFASAVPLTYDAIYGRSNNYGIQPINKIKYFNEIDFTEDDRKISDIISQNIFRFINKGAKGKWEVEELGSEHNIFVVSNKIENVSEYFFYKENNKWIDVLK